jgi:hypothetical protein
MKKLFVLFLCLVGVAGFVSAGVAHPPGASALELTGYGFYEAAVTPATVLIMETPFREFSDQILAVSDIMVSGLPRIDFVMTIDNPVLPDVPGGGVDYPLRL